MSNLVALNRNSNIFLDQSSSSGDSFQVPYNVATMSDLVKQTTGDDEDELETGGEPIPLPNVTTPILEKVIAYCTHYQTVEAMQTIETPLNSNRIEEMVQPWYVDFIHVEKSVLFDLVAAANFMDIKPLLDLTCLAVAILIKGKSASELREMFNISSELTAEEEEEITTENQWANQEAQRSAEGDGN